jgi:hypothetical protein
VPYFGRIRSALVATVGINPSIREFVNRDGDELAGQSRRLPTLGSLRLKAWRQANATHIKSIADACSDYFAQNPYLRWFGVLESVLAYSGASYYGERPVACHLDLVPYATVSRWGDLAPWQRQRLLVAGSGLLGRQIGNSSIETLILNGRSVINHFAAISDVRFREIAADGWRLVGAKQRSVPGVAYTAVATKIGGVILDVPVTVIGFNHNLQSSFGVTRVAIASIGEWVSLQLVNQ